MGKSWTKTTSITEKVSRWCSLLGASFIALMMLMTVSDVTSRTLLNRSIGGALEMVSLLMVGVVYFSLSYTQITGSHVRVELVTSHVSKRTQAIIEVITLFLALVILALFLWASVDRTIYSWQIKEYYWGLIPFPIYPSRTLMPFGILLLWMAVLIRWIRFIGVLRGHQPQETVKHLPSHEELI